MRIKDELLMEEIYEEGLYSRLKAGQAGRRASREAGGTIGLKAKQKLASATGMRMSSKDEKRSNTASMAKSNAQAEQLVIAYKPKLQKLAQRLKQDMDKMAVDPSLIKDDAFRKLLNALISM